MLSHKRLALFIEEPHLEQLVRTGEESGDDGSLEVPESGQERRRFLLLLLNS